MRACAGPARAAERVLDHCVVQSHEHHGGLLLALTARGVAAVRLEPVAEEWYVPWHACEEVSARGSAAVVGTRRIACARGADAAAEVVARVVGCRDAFRAGL